MTFLFQYSNKGLHFPRDWKHWISAQLTVSHFCLLQKLRDIFALEARRTLMSFCGTPLMPCRKPVSMATLSKAFFFFLYVKKYEYILYEFWSFSSLHVCRLDRQTQATTLVHQIFGGYLRSRGIAFFLFHRQKCRKQNASTAVHCPHICCFSYLLVIHYPVDQTSTSLNNKCIAKILKVLEITLHIV